MERQGLRILRVKKRLSQAQMAEKLGYSRGHYARFENGDADMTLRFLQALENAFGLTFEEAKELTKLDNEKK